MCDIDSSIDICAGKKHITSKSREFRAPKSNYPIGVRMRNLALAGKAGLRSIEAYVNSIKDSWAHFAKH